MSCVDCGSHEVALCKVVSMISAGEVNHAEDELDHLSTRRLREDSIISEFGRAITGGRSMILDH